MTTAIRSGQLWRWSKGGDACLMFMIARKPDQGCDDAWLTYEVWDNGNILFSQDWEKMILDKHSSSYTLLSDCPEGDDE